jgi:hypothetical protein
MSSERSPVTSACNAFSKSPGSLAENARKVPAGVNMNHSDGVVLMALPIFENEK